MTCPQRIALALAAASLPVLGGCATFETDVVASVDEVELSRDELNTRAEDLDLVRDGRIDGDLARTVISTWVALQIADRVGLVDRYLEGPVDSGVTCVFGASAPDADGANEWLERLRTGEAWDDLLAEVAPDAPLRGRTECLPTAGLGEVGEQLGGLSVEDPYRVVVFEDGRAVLVRMQAIEHLDGFELLRTFQAVDPPAVADAIDLVPTVEVDVAPAFGAFDSETFAVIPLGELNTPFDDTNS